MSLLGNPYPSAIEWNNNWTTSNIDATIYVYDGSAGQYLVWNRTLGTGTMPNGEIPPAQGFWLKANGSSPAVTIPQNERIHTGEAYYKSASDNTITFEVSGNDYSDKLLINFNSSATEAFDSEFDAYKLYGIAEAPQIYTTMGGEDLTLNSLPIKTYMNIPMGFETELDGKFILSSEGLEMFKNKGRLYLEDKLLNEMNPIDENTMYKFYATSSDDADRFNLHIKLYNDENISADKSSGIDIFAVNKDIYVSLGEHYNSDIYVFDLMGRLITKQAGIANSMKVIPVQSNKGMYVVKVVDNGEIYSKKIYLK
jgi:hypothetical protein